jgi:uncharacterized protein YdiU (UPF0061 family)
MHSAQADRDARHWPFDSTYAQLPQRFFARLEPTPVRAPKLVRLNAPLARTLGLDPGAFEDPAEVAVLAGSRVPDTATPLAMAYAGHQFGGWVPQLGDGRAILLGELIGTDGVRRDVHLKGAGATPYSRGGDGRNWIGPALREYLVSESMHALGVPTTRALALLETGEPVYREGPRPGAIVVRIASSHLRIGTFEFFAGRGDVDGLRRLMDYAIARHDPDLSGADPAERPLLWLSRVMERQASLVARWLGIGFVHGVMNTDNTTISGETIDYGPCAFVDTFHPDTVFSSIDRNRRYAFRKQPEIAHWNLSRLASAVLPLVVAPGEDVLPEREDPRVEAGIARATATLEGFPAAFDAAWAAVIGPKLGLPPGKEAVVLGRDLMGVMSEAKADFTRTFRELSALPADGGPETDTAVHAELAESAGTADFDAWAARWRAAVAESGAPDAERQATMRGANPALIPRNHRVEAAIQDALEGDYTLFERLLEAWSRPYEDRPEYLDLTEPPTPEQVVTRTFCGT